MQEHQVSELSIIRFYQAGRAFVLSPSWGPTLRTMVPINLEEWGMWGDMRV